MNRKIVFSVGEFYHLYNRGVDKRTIFTESSEYHRFIKLMFFANSTTPVDMRELNTDIKLSDYLAQRGETIVDIGAYCLMPNHFHILTKEKVDGGISLFMKKLLTGYSMYFNKKKQRKGKLFESVFYAIHADTDQYLKYLFSYIHLNPVKIIDPLWKELGVVELTNTKQFLSEYKFSSLLDYLGTTKTKREEELLLNKEAFPQYFENSKDIDEHIDDWLNYKGDTFV